MCLETRTLFVLLVFAFGALGQQATLYNDILQNAGKFMQIGSTENDNLVNLYKLLSQVDQQKVLEIISEVLYQNGNSTYNSDSAADILSSLPNVIELLSKVPNSKEILSDLLESGISSTVLANDTTLLSRVRKSNRNISSLSTDAGNITAKLDSSTDGILSTILKAANLPPYLLGPAKSILNLIQAGKMNDAMSLISSLSNILKPASKTEGSNKQPSAFATDEISETCMKHVKMTLSAIQRGDLWAMKMVDAMGKFPSDVLEGNLRWLGSYDECKGITASIRDDKNETTPAFRGQYCLVVMPLNDTLSSLAGGQADMLKRAYLALGMCIPDSCNKTEFVTAFNQVLSKIPLPDNKHLSVVYSLCQKNELEYDTKAIAALVVCGIFAALMIVATAYDVLSMKWQKWKENLQKNGALQNGQENELKIEPMSVGNEPNVVTMESNVHEQQAGEPVNPSQITKSHHIKATPAIPVRLLLSFSVYTNGKKLLNTDQGSERITAIDGIRFLSMSWIILGHTYSSISNFVVNLTFGGELFSRWTFTAISNALVSVDTFFVLSGLLVSYLVLKKMKKKTRMGGINWGLFYFHRYWRLTPPYMLILFVYVTTFPYWSDGPVWQQGGLEKDYCSDTWWLNLFYINNLATETCFGHTWYLALDMQFYIISPLLFVPLFYNEIIGVAVCVVFLLTTTISAGVISSKNNLQPSVLGGGEKGVTHGDYFNDYYVKPWCRMGPYIIGILGGYILYKTQCKIKINKILNLSIWIFAAGVSCAILYGLYGPIKGDHPLSNDVSALYNATHRSVWGACVCWVVIACATGNGGFVNTLLSWKGFVPVSRLTYCAYLVHPSIVNLFQFSIRKPIYLTDLTLLYLFFGHLVMSYGVSFVLSLAFEMPMMGLEKVIFGGMSNKPVNKPPCNGEPQVAGANNYLRRIFNRAKVDKGTNIQI